MTPRCVLPLLIGCGVCLAQSAAGPAAAKDSAAAGPSAKELAQQIRAAALDPEQCYRVRDLTLAREDLKLYLTDGYLIFSKPVNGERISAVFTAEVEGGDGEVLLLPPFRGERQSLARFTQSPNLDEHFRAAVLVFSDGAAQTLLDSIAQEGTNRKVPELGPLLAEQWTPALANIEARFDLRLVQDLLTPQPGRRGLLFGAIAGKTLGNFEVFYDLGAQNQIAAGRQTGPEKHYAYDVWTNFAARSFRKGTAKPFTEAFSEERFQIDASLDADLFLKANVRTTIKAGQSGLRTLAFEVAHAMQVTSARVDGQPAELLSNDGPLRGNPVTDAQNGSFLVIPAAELAPSSTHEIEFEEQGSVISPAGNDVYFVAARSNWYPRRDGGGDSGVSALALYDLTFRYPKRLTLVTAGEVTEDRIDGDFKVTRRVTPVPIRMAGFNLGDYVRRDFEKANGSAPVHIEVYGNRRLGNRPPASRSKSAAGPRGADSRRAAAHALPSAACRSPRCTAPAVSTGSSGAVAGRGRGHGLRAPILLRIVRAAGAQDPDGIAHSGNLWAGLPGLGVSVYFVLSRPQSAARHRTRPSRASVLLGPDRGARGGASMVGQTPSSRPVIRMSGSPKGWRIIRR